MKRLACIVGVHQWSDARVLDDGRRLQVCEHCAARRVVFPNGSASPYFWVFIEEKPPTETRPTLEIILRDDGSFSGFAIVHSASGLTPEQMKQVSDAFRMLHNSNTPIVLVDDHSLGVRFSTVAQVTKKGGGDGST
jgi:hypothetical protein